MNADGPPELVGQSPGVVALRAEIARLVERSRATRRFPPILIQGETGTGKGLLARTLHRGGPRASRPFVDIDCTVIPETLLEGELFGYERGAFTDARRAKKGLFQTAHGGTLFLDELGLVPLSLQTKLLKAIEDREVRPLGSTRRDAVDIWIIAATNEALSRAVETGAFRADLYHRISAVTLWLPPLRDRGEDILLLADHFLDRACADYGVAPKALSSGARDALMAYSWPGNVRELGNVIERVVLLSDDSAVTADVLGLASRPTAQVPNASRLPARSVQRRAKALTRAEVTDALRRAGMKLAPAAALLGVPRNTLRYQLGKLGIPFQAAPPLADDRAVRVAEPDEARRRATADWKSPHVEVAPIEGAPVAVLFVRFLPHRAISSLQSGTPIRAAIEKITEHGGTASLLEEWDLRAAFAPVTGEKPASNAARAALALMKEVARSPESERVASLKIGLDTDSEEDAVDDGAVPAGDLDTLTRRARELAGAGDPGSILVSGRAAATLARKFSLERVIIEHGGGPLHGFRLVARNTMLDDFRGSAVTPFVGRAEELDSLVRTFEIARAGKCQIVGIRAESGLGKSRLLWEFKRRLEGQAASWIIAHCLPNGVGGRASAINELVAGMLGIGEDDDPETVAQKVRLGIEGCGSPQLRTVMEDNLLRFLDVLPPSDHFGDPSPEAARQQFLETLTHLARERSARRPLILVLEDMHWVDRDSEQLIMQLAERLPSSALMLVCSYRPEQSSATFARPAGAELRLVPLSRDDSAKLVRNVAADQRVDERTMKTIVERGSGSPLFLEELTLMAASGAARPEAVPATIRAALLVRFATLEPRTKKVLLAAAVLGPVLRENVLSSLLEDPADLTGDLRRLEALGLLGTTEGPGAIRLRFRHVLLQEVVYETLSPAERAALHARAAATLERLHGEGGDQPLSEGLVDELARHHAAAGQERQALTYLLQSAKHAYERYALTEALERLERAERLGAHLPPGPEWDARAVELAVRRSWPLAQLGRLEEARDVLLKRLDIVGQLHGTPMAGEYYFGLATAYDRLGDHRLAASWAVAASVEANRVGNQALLGRSHHALALVNFSAGHFDLGIEHGLNAVEHLNREGERWWAGRARWSLGMNYLGLGELGQAVAVEQEAKRIGAEIQERRLEADATLVLGWVQALLGDAEASRRNSREACRLAPDLLVRAIAIAARGGGLVEAGRFPSAIPMLEVAVTQLGAFKARQVFALASAFLAEALASTDAARGQSVARLGWEAAEDAAFPFGAVWTRRALATVALKRGHLVQAHEHATAALELSGRIGARYEWARTSLTLAEIAHAGVEREACARYVRGALAAFQVLGIAHWSTRAQRLAVAMQIPLRESGGRSRDAGQTGASLEPEPPI